MALENKQNLKLGLNQVENFKPIIMKQFDKNSRVIEIVLKDANGTYQIPEGAIAKIQATKPDGKIIYDDCIIVDNKVIYKAKEQFTTAVGNVQCEIGLYEEDTLGDIENDRLIQSATFVVKVEESVMNREGIVSTDEFNALTIAMNSVGDLTVDVNDAIARANTSIEEVNLTNTNIQNAEDVRVINEEDRALAESTRVSNEDTRITNETDRNNAEESRVLAEQTRESQETLRQTNTSTAITNTNLAADRANTAAEAAEDVVAGTGLIPVTEKGAPNGVATLDATGKVPSAQLPTIASTASDITYDNETSNLASTDTQSAIDELGSEIGDLSTLNTTSNTDLVGSINELESEKLDKVGDTLNNTVTFEDYSVNVPPSAETALNNIVSGGKISTLFSNVKAFCKGVVTLGRIANNDVTTVEGLVWDARRGKAIRDDVNAINNKLAKYCAYEFNDQSYRIETLEQQVVSFWNTIKLDTFGQVYIVNGSDRWLANYHKTIAGWGRIYIYPAGGIATFKFGSVTTTGVWTWSTY